MKKQSHFIAVFIVFCNFYHLVLRGQSNCDCPIFANYRDGLNTFILSESTDIIEANRLSAPLFQSNIPSCRAKGFEFIAEVYLLSRKVDSVEVFLKHAQELFDQNSCKGEFLINNYRILSTLYHFKGDYKKSIEYCFKALEILDNSDKTLRKCTFLTKIATNFVRLQQYDKALEYAHQVLSLTASMPPSVEKAILLDDLNTNFLLYHQVKINQQFYRKTAGMSPDSAKKYIPVVSFDKILDTVQKFALESKSLAQQFGHTRTLIKSFRKLQLIEFWHNNLNSALAYIDSSLYYCRPVINDSDFFMAYGDKADIYFKMHNHPLALRFADSCIVYAQKTGAPLSIANAFMTKSDIAEEMGDWKEAYFTLKNVRVIMDSVQNIERTQAVNELEKKYNQAKNEKTIKELAQQKRIYLLIALAALLAIVIVIFYMRQQTLKHKQTILETEQRLNRARMNPHFFFNALTSLQSFALRENDGKTLATNLSKFSNIMRETLESTYKEYVTIEQEIEFLNEYLEIQKIRFPKKFRYDIIADNDLEIDEILIPSMIIQPFVENSIEHGFAGLVEEGQVLVHFKKINNEISIEISDNGRGLNTPSKIKNEHISRASQIIKDRIYLLNIKLKTNARFSINNHQDEKGVVVTIFLPIIFTDESPSS